MSSYVSEKIRKLVRERAKNLCEYCLFHEDHSFFTFEIDHIISLKHAGLTEHRNLAYSCFYCNRNKGSDVGSVLLPSQEFVRFFNPRTDRWSDHFQFEKTLIKPITQIGEVTIKILDFNHPDRIDERQLLIDARRYPHPSAKDIITSKKSH